VRVLGAGERQTSYHARNRAAALGTADWLVFLDADVVPPADLLARYFEPVPDARVGVLAGAVVDEEPAADESTPASRYAWLKSSMSQEITLGHDQWAFAQTANAAVRRKAFEQVGGFEDGVRSGGDADLCFRLRAAGWELERRSRAAVVHRNRQTVPRMLAQRARHGAGAGWLSERWPGALPRRRWAGLAWWSLRRTGAGLVAVARRDRDAALLGLLDGPAVRAFELGRLIPNHPRPRLRRRGGS
jgi:GT2 family glycosyltransferase